MEAGFGDQAGDGNGKQDDKQAPNKTGAEPASAAGVCPHAGVGTTEPICLREASYRPERERDDSRQADDAGQDGHRRFAGVCRERERHIELLGHGPLAGIQQVNVRDCHFRSRTHDNGNSGCDDKWPGVRQSDAPQDNARRRDQERGFFLHGIDLHQADSDEQGNPGDGRQAVHEDCAAHAIQPGSCQRAERQGEPADFAETRIPAGELHVERQQEQQSQAGHGDAAARHFIAA
jgi:hypothetical protein